MGRLVASWQAERPDLDLGSIGILTPLVRLAQLAASRRAPVLAAHGIDHGHLDVLGALRASGAPYSLPAGELSRRCGVTAGATTQRVQAMERLGLVERVREAADRRTVHVRATAHGLERLDEVLADVLASDEALLVGVPAGERATLERLLRGWLAAVESGAESDGERGSDSRGSGSRGSGSADDAHERPSRP